MPTDEEIRELLSLPSRERGLKFYYFCIFDPERSVAPLAGAWIEISKSKTPRPYGVRRSPRGSVD